MDDSQLIRAAAAYLRELGEAATPGPLVAITDNGRKNGTAVLGAVANRGTGQAIAVYAATNGHRLADAQLAATLDGRAALALADHLDAYAARLEHPIVLALVKMGGKSSLHDAVETERSAVLNLAQLVQAALGRVDGRDDR